MVNPMQYATQLQHMTANPGAYAGNRPAYSTAFAHQVRAAPEHVTGGAHVSRVAIGLGEHPTAE